MIIYCQYACEQVACAERSRMKIGDVHDDRTGVLVRPRDVEGLQRALDDTIWFPNCPHGRPILSVLPESDIERRFLRR